MVCGLVIRGVWKEGWTDGCTVGISRMVIKERLRSSSPLYTYRVRMLGLDICLEDMLGARPGEQTEKAVCTYPKEQDTSIGLWIK